VTLLRKVFGMIEPAALQPIRLRRIAYWTAFLAGLVFIAHLLDPWAQRTLVDPAVYNRDWGRLLRVLGFYPLWLIVAVVLLLDGRNRWIPPTRGGPCERACAAMLALAPALGGAVAELGKLTFRRLRPGEIPGEYAFRALADRPFYSGGLGLPSSHTLVAFAAAATMARIFPRTAPLWYLLAAGCGLTRVLAGAHFLSDVVVAGILGWATAALVWKAGAMRIPARAALAVPAALAAPAAELAVVPSAAESSAGGL